MRPSAGGKQKADRGEGQVRLSAVVAQGEGEKTRQGDRNANRHVKDQRYRGRPVAQGHGRHGEEIQTRADRAREAEVGVREDRRREQTAQGDREKAGGVQQGSRREAREDGVEERRSAGQVSPRKGRARRGIQETAGADRLAEETEHQDETPRRSRRLGKRVRQTSRGQMKRPAGVRLTILRWPSRVCLG